MVLRHHCRLLPGAEGSQLGSSGDGSPDHARSKKCPSSRGGHRCAVRRHTDLASPHLRRRPPISAVSFLGGRHSQNRRRRSRRLLQAINCGRTPRKEKKRERKKNDKNKAALQRAEDKAASSSARVGWSEQRTVLSFPAEGARTKRGDRAKVLHLGGTVCGSQDRYCFSAALSDGLGWLGVDRRSVNAASLLSAVAPNIQTSAVITRVA